MGYFDTFTVFLFSKDTEGRRVFWTQTIAGSLMTALGVSVRSWSGTAFFACCTTMFLALLWRLRRARKRPVSGTLR